jgi:membrane protein DedA with SNARE-associated domain
VFALAFIGKQVGANWEKWKDSLHYVDYAVVALVVVGVVFLVVRNRRGRKRPAGAAADAPGA